MLFSEKDDQKLFEHPLFDGLDRERLTTILRAHDCKIRTFEAGTPIDPSLEESQKKIGLLFGGHAVVTTKDRSRNTLLRFLRSGDVFGIANLFCDEPFVSVIRAETDCRVLLLPKDTICALLETEPVFLYRYLSFLSGRICYLNRKIGYLTGGSAERRLALYLGSFPQNEWILSDSISSLSELLDIGRASLYRAFDRLCADGYIQKDGRKIRILQLDAMLKAYQ